MSTLPIETQILIMNKSLRDSLDRIPIETAEPLRLISGIEIRTNPYLLHNTVLATDSGGTILAIIKLGGTNAPTKITVIPEEERFNWKKALPHRVEWEADTSPSETGYVTRVWPTEHRRSDQGAGAAPAEEPNLRAGRGADRDSNAEPADRGSDEPPRHSGR